MVRLPLVKSAIAGFLVASHLLGSAPAPVAAAGLNAEELRAVDLINAERGAHGLPALTVDAGLAASASAYAAAMARSDSIAHIDAGASTFVQRNEAHGYQRWTVLAENLGAGQPTPEEVVVAWLRSPTHRANALLPQACDIGIGRAVNPNSRYVVYWAMETGC